MKKPRNKFETRIDRQLKRSKVNYGYETEKIPYIISSHYIPDFTIQTKTGYIYIECKGYFRAEDKRKLRAVKKMYPAKDIRILFYASNKQYIKWAEKNNFPYAIEKIPKEWLNESSISRY